MSRTCWLCMAVVSTHCTCNPKAVGNGRGALTPGAPYSMMAKRSGSPLKRTLSTEPQKPNSCFSCTQITPHISVKLQAQLDSTLGHVLCSDI